MRANLWALLGGLLVLNVAQPSVAKTSVPKRYVDAKTRQIEGGRKVLIVIAQDKLLPGIDSFDLGLTNAANAIEKAIDKGLIERGRKQIIPLTDALTGYDFDTPMKAALISAAHSADWIRAQDIELTRDESDAAIEKALNDSNTRQMLVLKAKYATDWRYTAMEVSVESTLLVRKIPKGQPSEARLKTDYIPYRQTFRSIVNLPGLDGTKREENIARWAADGAVLARRALDIGVRRVPPLLVQNLQEDEKAAADWRKHKRMTIPEARKARWVAGPPDSGILFIETRSGALIRLQPLDPSFVETVTP